MRRTSLDEPSSWVIRQKDTGKVIAETYDNRLVGRLNTERYEAVPILQYLGELNRTIREAR
jgi:hypothetical protein